MVFQFLDEREIADTAAQINFVTSSLHWKSSRRRGREYAIRDGVTISPGRQEPPSLAASATPSERDAFSKRMQQWYREEDATKAVSLALIQALQDSGIDAKLGFDGLRFPPGTVVVGVGPKPNHALEATIKELATPPAPTAIPIPDGGVLIMGGNRLPIPEENTETKKQP